MGFTAILVAWLAGLNPVAMVFTSLLVQFFNIGAEYAGSNFGFGTAFPEIITAVFFFVVIASEFFVNYNVKINPALIAKFKKNKDGENTPENDSSAEQKSENKDNSFAEQKSVDSDNPSVEQHSEDNDNKSSEQVSDQTVTEKVADNSNEEVNL